MRTSTTIQTTLSLTAKPGATITATGTQLYLRDALEASRQTRPYIRQTPLVSGDAFLDQVKSNVWFKQDFLQEGRSFKDRGAAYALLQLNPEQLAHGVKTTSHGNHGNGVARMAHMLGVRAYIYVPLEAARCKTDNMERNGATVVRTGETFEEALARCLDKKGPHARAAFIHPYDDLNVMVGQSGLLADTLTQRPDADTVLFPIGGGGMISRSAAAFKDYNPQGKVIGVVYEGSNSALLSKQAGARISIPKAATFCDGTALEAPGEHTFPYIRDFVDEVVQVSQQALASAMARYYQLYGHKLEAAGALTAAALLEHPRLAYGTTVAMQSGRNVDDSSWNLAMRLAEQKRVVQ